MKNLEELEPPKDLKIQTAFKIVKLKADVKDYANTAAGSAWNNNMYETFSYFRVQSYQD